MLFSLMRIIPATFRAVVTFGLILIAFWFSYDVWTKFAEKVTTFRSFTERNEDIPTTVVCFDSFLKRKTLLKYNLSPTQFLQFSDLPVDLELTLGELYEQAFYKMGKDFEFNFAGKYFLNEGLNVITERKNISVETILTILKGRCYKITFNFMPMENDFLIVNFDDSMQPSYAKLEIYITSEDNADGIVDMTWANGKKLEISLQNSLTSIKLEATEKKLLKETSDCVDGYHSTCVAQVINDYATKASNCCRICSFMSLPKLNEKEIMPQCETIEEYLCMKWPLIHLLRTASESCPKHCSQVQYSGDVMYYIDSETNKSTIGWMYSLSKTKEVYEEYLVYDVAGFIGSVGGTLGLFVGFSIADCIFYVIDWLANFIKKL